MHDRDWSITECISGATVLIVWDLLREILSGTPIRDVIPSHLIAPNSFNQRDITLPLSPSPLSCSTRWFSCRSFFIWLIEYITPIVQLMCNEAIGYNWLPYSLHPLSDISVSPCALIYSCSLFSLTRVTQMLLSLIDSIVSFSIFLRRVHVPLVIRDHSKVLLPPLPHTVYLLPIIPASSLPLYHDFELSPICMICENIVKPKSLISIIYNATVFSGCPLFDLFRFTSTLIGLVRCSRYISYYSHLNVSF